MPSDPLVSCILPTANRRRWVPHAIRLFLTQDYPRKELVILDDGTDSVADLVPTSPQVRYIRSAPGQTLGAKRNACVQHCAGDQIMHWDDDDWMAPHRISYQVDALLKAKAEVCGLRQMLFHDLSTGTTWLYDYPADQRPWLAGGSLLYTLAFWECDPFPDVPVASDTYFIWQRNLDRALALEDYRFYVAMIHPGNTSPKHTNTTYWRRWPGNLREIMGEELSVYRVDGLAAIAANDASCEQRDAMQRSSATPNIIVSERSAPPPRADIATPMSERSMNSPTNNHVTVSIPFYRCHSFIRRTVNSVLNQSHTDLTLVVVNDGDPDPPWPILSDIDDPRLVRFDLQANRGRYFADAVVLNATDSLYFVVQDADDWSSPDRIAMLLHQLRADHADAATSACACYTLTNGVPTYMQRESIVERLATPLSDQFKHRLWHYNLFKVEPLRAIGGYYAGFRIGYDTLLMNFLLMTSRIACMDEPLYNRLRRPHSLVSSSSTGLRSATRRAVSDQLQQLYATAYRWYQQYLHGELQANDLAAMIRRLCQEQIVQADHEALATEVERLQTTLQHRNIVCHHHATDTSSVYASTNPLPPVAPAARVITTDVQQILNDSTLAWDGWTIGKPVAQALAERLAVLKPKRILELGSGNSTVVLAACAARHSCELISIEHDPHYYQQTKQILMRFSLLDYVDLRLAPLTQHTWRNGERYPWYDASLTGKFDFVFADGPPEKHGRQAMLFALATHLGSNWEIWLHDGNRLHEQTCLALWQQWFPFTSTLHPIDSKGVLILTPQHANHAVASPHSPHASIGISCLTGKRTELLKRTITALHNSLGTVLSHAFVVVLVNGDDDVTSRYVEDLPFVDKRLHLAGRMRPVGEATSLLMRELLARSELRYILHLEDDWEARVGDDCWIEQARILLDGDTQIGQVRLRHSEERVLPYHMVTRQPIRWQPREGYRYASAAHFTFNPSLVRVRDAARIFPSQSEAHAQRNFLQLGLGTAQLLPGVFVHLGEHHSLRASLGR